MTKKLLYVFSFILGISSFQAENKIEAGSESLFYCDTNVLTGVQMSNITLTSGTVTWTADPDTPNNFIRYRIPGTTTWMIATPTPGQNSFTITNLQPCTVYEVQVAKICTTQGMWSNPIFFTTTLNYCSSASTDTSMMHISNVTVTSSGVAFPMISDSGASNYTDYRSDLSRRVKLYIGSTGNKLSVANTWTGTPGTTTVTAWIDLNANGIFESTERVMVANNITQAAPAVSVFTIPSLAALIPCGVTMRVVTNQTMPADACSTFTYGEVEDYGVDLINLTLGVKESGKSVKPEIYPNPASDVLNISGISEATDYKIYNVLGQKSGEGKVSDHKVNLSHLSEGIYFIQLKDKNSAIRLKFIKK
ncbi:Por secretion system C-terminal sorting domain-containing protein [Chryseobacterium rhizoplanae]|uniref:Por secretion system C-terminal sorting domain-containing protein n=1 Tax=Chryseobacterium rhizoplanae TaxID=1609531 RepID=A0A521DV79_9FLAO|nr:GEVED domain-containing protein [Chryseobacterium rhizoplanae]SMO75555.1 Por secretion system C-terminal sorting domain-containing protein [Chryseobacterium rhizoplanae]